MKGWRLITFGVLMGLFAAGAILLIAKPKYGTPIQLLPAPTLTKTSPPKATETRKLLQIQIGGQVATPGIYQLPKDTRLEDLIALAGGLTPLADTVRINFAAILSDGDYFYIPTADEEIPETAANSILNLNNRSLEIGFPINLNTAAQEELEALPGIGPTKAKAIIAYRETNGAFTSVDELLNVDGIGPATLETIIELIYVEP
jgi:competence protein ComEA